MPDSTGASMGPLPNSGMLRCSATRFQHQLCTMRSRCRATALGQSSRSEKRPTHSCERAKPSNVMPRRRAEATQLVKGPRMDLQGTEVLSRA
eukprot:7146908-Pyramimonas_sp.AAC.1